MNHESVRLHGLNAKGCSMLGVTMATNHSLVLILALIRPIILCSNKISAELFFVNSE